ncbi:MAG: beta-1,6-N-acetylglucosaminyltransferase [Firmicutes bacterium]|nr:beta-1,6-N-acetylglucosaminyltransferase [Bacillota bacterium]
MKLIYLIHCHKNVNQVNNLIDLLSDENTEIYVNVDLKSKIEIAKINPKAHLIKKRIPILWGDYSQVQATLNSIEEIHKNEANYSHIIFISAQDFPIKSNETIKNTIKENTDYLDYCIIPENKNWNVKYRYERYHYTGKFELLRPVVSFFTRVFRKLGYCRQIPGNPIPYGGSQWWILSKKSIEFLISFVNNSANQTFINFFRTVVCCDELFFQMILCNSDRMKNIINNNYRYIDWSEHKANPNNLVLADYEKIINSNKLFCRKIEPEISDALVEKLLEYRDNRCC